MSKRFIFVCIYVVYLATSLVFCFERITKHPEQTDPVRWHQHLGDGASEDVNITAHKNWQRRGYIHPYYGVMCVGSLDDNCHFYSHMPTAPYVIGSLTIGFFEKFFDWKNSLIGARFVLLATHSAVFAFAILLLVLAFDLSLGSGIIFAIALASTRGSWLYIDNLWHNVSLGAMGVAVGAAVWAFQQKWNTERLSRFLFLYQGAFALTLVTSWECSTAGLILPAILLFHKDAGIAFDRRVMIKKYLLLAAITVFICIGITFLQSCLAFGGLSALLADWKKLVLYRIAGSESDRVAMGGFFSYIWLLVWREKFMTGCGGFFAMGAAGLIALYQRNFRTVGMLVFVYFAAISWNIIMVQHSWIHIFASRFVVWPAMVSLGFLLVFVKQRFAKKWL